MENSCQKLSPLAYHIELRNYLKAHERELWDWFSSAKARADFVEGLRLELLKTTYRLDRETHPDLYRTVDEARAGLALDLPVTIYQGPSSPQANAAVLFAPGEVHLVFSGPILTLLDGPELKSVIGHELAHYQLWLCEDGEFCTADRLIRAVANDPGAQPSHEQAARRYQLYTEIFADRGALCATGDIGPVVAALVKTQTGLAQVSSASFLKQAEEIFAKGDVATTGISHPETFIRARALALWQQQGEETETAIAAMLEGALALDELDLLGQVRLAGHTREMMAHFLRPRWMQTMAMLGQAKLYFPDFQPAAQATAADPAQWKFADTKIQEYFSYVLLDFATADPELDEMPLVAALDFSRQLDMDELFEKLAAKELKMKTRDVRKLKEQASELLAKAEAGHE